MPITTDTYDSGYIFLKFDYSDSTGNILASSTNSDLKAAFLYSTSQDNFGQVNTLRIKFSNGDIADYTGLAQDFSLSEKVVHGTFWSKAKKQTFVFTGFLVPDEKYSEKAIGFVTEKLIEGVYSDDIWSSTLDFQKDGILLIKDKSNGTVLSALDWSVVNNAIVAVRYRAKDSRTPIVSTDAIKECRKTKSCEIGQRRTYVVLKVTDEGMVLLRKFFLVALLTESPIKQ